MNKNTLQRIFQLKGWQVRKRALGSRPRIEVKVSATERPTSVGRRISAGYGAVKNAGWCWPW